MTKSATDTEMPLIITFLQKLNVARRHLSIYPPEHPAIRESIGKTLATLQEFFLSSPQLSIGIAPNAVYYEEIKFDDQESAVADFCHYFSGLGIATVGFLPGLGAEEIIRFIQLLRSDRDEIETFGGFSLLLSEQRIFHIQVIAVDYEVFQAKALDSESHPSATDLWENFLFGLNKGILEFDDREGQQLNSFAEMLNQAQTDATVQSIDFQQKLSDFIDNSLYANQSSLLQQRAGVRLNQLLQQLNNEAREHFLTRIVHSLNKTPQPAENILTGLSPHYINASLATLSNKETQISSRLVNLLDMLSRNDQQLPGKSNQTNKYSPDVVKARLDELFREEQQDQYLPNQYQSALADVFTDNIPANLIPDDIQAELRQLIEAQSIEQHFSAIVLRLLHNSQTKEYEAAIQNHLLELTKFYLDTGHFNDLKSIYQGWSQHLNSGNAHLDIFADKIIAAHSQKTFISEVLDGFDIWEESKRAELIAYIKCVGEVYVAPIIERLGLAPKKKERMMWLKVLQTLSHDAQQILIKSLKDDRWYLIRNLLSVLGQTPNQLTLKASLPFCSHEHPMVRIEAIRNLLRTNPATGNRHLERELENTDPAIKDAAIKAATLSKDQGIIAILHTIIQTQATSDEELHQQISAIQSLGQIGSTDTLIIFRRLLTKKGFFISQRIKTLQQEMIKTLPFFKGPVAEKLVSELNNSKYKVQLQAAFSNDKRNPNEAS